jgi:hypothetical protein
MCSADCKYKKPYPNVLHRTNIRYPLVRFTICPGYYFNLKSYFRSLYNSRTTHLVEAMLTMTGYNVNPYTAMPSKGYPIEPSLSHQYGYDSPTSSYELPLPASPLVWIPPQPFPGALFIAPQFTCI